MGSSRATDALRAAGIEVVTGETLARAAVDAGRISAVTLSGGATFDVGLVLVTGPLRPQSALLAAAGAELNEDGSVVVDECCRTSLAHVYAAARRWRCRTRSPGWPVWLPQAGLADCTAMVAGVVGRGRAGAAVARPQHVHRPGRRADPCRTGLGLEEAIAFAAEEEVGLVSVHGSSCERPLSSSQPLAIDLVFHKGDGRLLGAEVAGKAGADKRVDVLSTAIIGGLTVERLSTLDLAYAPPFSTTRDVVNVAGWVAAAARRRPGPALDRARAGRADRLGGHRGRGAGARPHRRGHQRAGHPPRRAARTSRRPAPGPPASLS